MTDIMSKETRSRVMARIHGKNTTPERQLWELLRAAGIKFRQHDASLSGKPDFVFESEKVVAFVDGDFWHGWRFPVWKHRMNSKWRSKIAETRRRDRNNAQRLRRAGWNVLRIWEHQFETNRLECVERIVDALGGVEVDWGSIKECEAKMPEAKRRARLPRP